ncbi:MAG: peptide chain release factor-like protein, partial [Planctomycetaceae bacterium]|nr:peptide chain release factor-like protein [Planctomycetaceae bacterium]
MMTTADSVKPLSGKIHPACLDQERLLKDCKIQYVRRSGPGGQHRNKVETGVVIKHLPTNLIGEASETRQQARNRQVAVFRLRVNLAMEYRLP